MYRILIVDDEKIERTGIKFLLGQLEEKFEIYEAVNGKEAVSWLQNNRVDILMTDVKMPFMDGLQLLEQVYQLYPDMMKIIISGYGEFSYAQKAMQFGVEEYILKPVDPAEFGASMKKLIKSLDERKAEENTKQLRITFFKEYVLNAILNGTEITELEKMAEGYYPLEFLQDYRRMMLIELNGKYFGGTEASHNPEFLAELGDKVDYLNLNTQQSVLLFKEESSDWKGIASGICDSIQKKCNGELKCHVAISSGISDPSQLIERYHEVELLMENRFYSLDSSIYMAENEAASAAEVCLDDDTLMRQMKQDVRTKDVVSLREHFERLFFNYSQNQKFSHIYVKFMFTNLLKMLCEAIPEKTEKEMSEDVDKLYRAVDMTGICEIIEKNIKQFEAYVQKDEGNIRREVEVVKRYIYAHYGEELSVELLAEQVFLAPSYLSTIFRKETGQNLSKFIKSYRMEKAREMLENTHEKIVMISEKVGYPNVSYFCQNFREYFGISPQKYRDKGEAYEESSGMD